MRGRERPLDLLEAAYRLDGSDDEWVRGMVETAASVFASDDLGAVGFLVSGRIDDSGHTVISEIRSPQLGGRASLMPGALKVLETYPHLPLELQQSLFFAGDTASTVSAVMGLGWALKDDPRWKQAGWDTSVTADSFGLKCYDGPLNALLISTGLREVTVLKKPEVHFWQRVAAHVGAACRLRRGCAASPGSADAVLSPTGKVRHLVRSNDGDAIKVGFARRRHARSRGVTPDAALEVWQGLHDGRWSLIDYVDSDGKAFVLAVRNEPAREVASTLTDRQRAAVALAALGYGNKQIAYALGLPAAAVAMLLARARAAIGVRTRAELVRSFKRTLAAPSGVQ